MTPDIGIAGHLQGKMLEIHMSEHLMLDDFVTILRATGIISFFFSYTKDKKANDIRQKVARGKI